MKSGVILLEDGGAIFGAAFKFRLDRICSPFPPSCLAEAAFTTCLMVSAVAAAAARLAPSRAAAVICCAIVDKI